MRFVVRFVNLTFVFHKKKSVLTRIYAARECGQSRLLMADVDMMVVPVARPLAWPTLVGGCTVECTLSADYCNE